MRVLTWNLLHGGEDSQSLARLDTIARVVREHDPDVVVFQEANGFDAGGNRILHHLENLLDRRGFLALAQTGYHVAAYVRRDERIASFATNSRVFYHSLLHLRLLQEDGTFLDILGVHLAPDSGQLRLVEAQYISKFARPDSSVLVLGDFNALDSQGSHQAELETLPPYYRTRYTIPGDPATADTRVALILEQAGFVDVARRSGCTDYTIPTKLSVFGSNFSRRRLDYVYATENLASRLERVQVVRSSDTDQASDHYPIVVDFDLQSDRAMSEGSR